MTDETLWRARAFDDVYARYEKPLYGFLVRFLGDAQDAEEVFHETFLAAVAGEFEDRGAGSFRAWIFAIARARAMNRARSRRRFDHAATRLRHETPESVEPVAGDDRERALDVAVRRLPPRLAEVYRLRAAGLSYEQMAEALRVPTGTVRSRIHAMIKSLREELALWIAN